MCGRMIVIEDGVAYFHFFDKVEGWVYQVAPEKYQQIARQKEKDLKPTEPTYLHVLEGTEVVPKLAYWTLIPPWIEEPTTVLNGRIKAPSKTHFNSRKDTLLKSSGWKRLLGKNRGIILAKGFYEWSDDELRGKQEKLVGKFTLKNSDLMPIACIWSPINFENNRILTFSVITTEPNESLRNLPHHRMPAILKPSEIASWLNPMEKEPEQYLRTTADEEIESDIQPTRKPKNENLFNL